MKKISIVSHSAFVLLLCFILFVKPTVAFGQKSTVLPAGDFNKKLLETPSKQVIDVRTPKEFKTGHLQNAVNINFNDTAFDSNIAALNKDEPVFVYCLAGGRSAAAAKKLQDAGFKTVYDLKGGVLAWENNNMPYVISTQPEAKDIFTQKEFENLLTNNPKMLIDFYAPWCSPCIKMEPFIKELQIKYEGKITIARINIDEAKTLAKQLKIEGFPVIITYKNGKELKRVEGFQSDKALEALINHYCPTKVWFFDISNL